MGYYFGPVNTMQGHNYYSHIAIAKSDNPEEDLTPIIRYAFGPYRTKNEAIKNAHYQFAYIKRFYFVNCTRPKTL